MSGLRRRAGEAPVNARDGHVNLMRKIAAEVLEILLSILRQKDRRRDFH